jgi:hypothetical protein
MRLWRRGLPCVGRVLVAIGAMQMCDDGNHTGIASDAQLVGMRFVVNAGAAAR